MGIVMFGDSKSPVIPEDGRALGIQFAVGAFTGADVRAGQTEGLSPGNVGVYRLSPQVKAAERLRIKLELLTAPLADS